jgi:carbonic anhydrase
MKKYLLIPVLLFAFFSVNAADNKASWSYSGKTGPENWAKLSPEFSDCAGRNQSPIDLKDFVEAQLPPIKINYQPGQQVINNGHTIKVNYAGGGGSIEIDGITFRLLQFHFHAPSENHINGKSFPLEAHLVHASDSGELAVIAVMFDKGDENLELGKIWSVMPKDIGGKAPLARAAKAYNLLPEERAYYRFSGSLTTPPCTEGVRWLVMKMPLTASAKQIEEFEKVMHHPNNRPIQPLNARTVLK